MLDIDTKVAKFHAKEIELWAYSPEGTKVWCKRGGDKKWILQKSPSWLAINQYIIDDKDAIERMTEIEAQNV